MKNNNVNPKIGVYGGSFDPVTKGHMDVIKRSASFLDLLIIGIASDGKKQSLFSLEERLAMLEQEIRDENIHNCKAMVFSGLIVDFATKNSASFLIRGVRAVSDFEYEFQMSCMNSRLNNNLQTIFIPASEKFHLVSSSLVKEVNRLGGDTGMFLSKNVNQKLKDKLSTS